MTLALGSPDETVLRHVARAACPLYYWVGPDTIEVDDDLDRLVESVEIQPAVDRHSVLHFVWRGRARPGRTLYRDFRSLGVGHELVCTLDQRPIVRRYWWPLYRSSHIAGDEGLHEQALAKIQRSVVADIQVSGGRGHHTTAILLSGGVDSGLIAALACRAGVDLTAYTIAFENRYGLNETAFARRVARACRIPHRIVRIHARDAERLIDAALSSSRPQPAPAAVTHAALREAIQEAGHGRALSGLGADECFGGYHKPLVHLAAQLHHMRAHDTNLAALFDNTVPKILRMPDLLFVGIAEFFTLEELARWSIDRTRVPNLVEGDVAFYQDALTALPDADPLQLMFAHEYQFRLSELLLPALTLDSVGDRPMFAFPFLDPNVFLWAAALGAERYYWHERGAWWAKRLLREAAGRLVPQSIVMRKRQVLLAPLAHWLLSQSLRTRVMEELGDSPLWKFGVLRHRLRDNLLGKLRRYRVVDAENRWQEQLWVLLVLCSWFNRRRLST